jgi:LTXXQ motif family protein
MAYCSFREVLAGLDTRLDTPPSIDSHHPDSGLARSLPTTPPARLDAISMRLNTMLQSVSAVRAALDDFYNSLSDEQKAQFNRIGRQLQTAQEQG